MLTAAAGWSAGEMRSMLGGRGGDGSTARETAFVG